MNSLHRASPGFSVILVLILMAALSVSALSFVRMSNFLMAFAREREMKEYQYWAAYGLMHYAIACIQSLPKVPADPIAIEHLPLDQSTYQGLIRFEMVGDKLAITVQVIGGKRTHQQLSHIMAIPIHLLA